LSNQAEFRGLDKAKYFDGFRAEINLYVRAYQMGPILSSWPYRKFQPAGLVDEEEALFSSVAGGGIHSIPDYGTSKTDCGRDVAEPLHGHNRKR
jgi:hypothetical protein